MSDSMLVGTFVRVGVGWNVPPLFQYGRVALMHRGRVSHVRRIVPMAPYLDDEVAYGLPVEMVRAARQAMSSTPPSGDTWYIPSAFPSASGLVHPVDEDELLQFQVRRVQWHDGDWAAYFGDHNVPPRLLVKNPL